MSLVNWSELSEEQKSNARKAMPMPLEHVDYYLWNVRSGIMCVLKKEYQEDFDKGTLFNNIDPEQNSEMLKKKKAHVRFYKIKDIIERINRQHDQFMDKVCNLGNNPTAIYRVLFNMKNEQLQLIECYDAMNKELDVLYPPEKRIDMGYTYFSALQNIDLDKY